MKNVVLNVAIIIGAIALGGLGGFIAYNYLNASKEDEVVLVDLPVAATNLESNTPITQSDITYIKVPEDAVLVNAIVDVNEIIDTLMVASNTIIAEGSIFTTNNTELISTTVVDKETIYLSSGMYLYPLAILDTSSYSVGNYIDISVTGTIGDLEVDSSFLEGVEIVAVTEDYLYLELTEEMYQDLKALASIDTVELNVTISDVLYVLRELKYANEYIKVLVESMEYY